MSYSNGATDSQELLVEQLLRRPLLVQATQERLQIAAPALDQPVALSSTGISSTAKPCHKMDRYASYCADY